LASSNPQPIPAGIDWEAASLAPPGAPRCERADATDCIVTTGESGTMLLVGDSHARMLMPTFEYVAEQRDLEFALAYSTSCPWMEAAIPKGETVGKERCIDVRQQLYGEQLESLDPDIIVLAGYPYSIFPEGLESTDPDLSDIPMPEILERLVNDSIPELMANGRRLIFIEPIPTFDANPLTCLSGASTADQCTFPPVLSTIEESLYRDAAASNEMATSIDLDGFGCPRLPICDPLQFGYPVWRDTNHFTAKFAELLGSRIDDQLEQTGVFDGIAAPN
jgi:hypothetical protein